MNSTAKIVNGLKSGTRLGICGATAVCSGLIIGITQPVAASSMAAWVIFAILYLSLCWITALTCEPHEINKIADKQDAGRATVTIFILIAAAASLVAVVLLYSSAKTKTGLDLILHILFSLLSVAASWVLVHTTLAFKYAHLYYSRHDTPLEFPRTAKPDYMDFMYFSFVIGCTFQVSDVQIASRHVRRIAMLHSVFSFAFNTLIVALTVNIVSGLIDN
ncbi:MULTISPECIES: DUF1345 domain-containing protein [Sphingobacteriaceae]|uniref:DUF1345 domain-containing protein n=1 Tax=Sphingobacteriaceae TaxID=84566 RepID=UPI000DE576F5|nr:DUF1345 domain-containing protein [Pedobacter nanyangensis]